MALPDTIRFTEPLTPGEARCLGLIAEGLTNKAIAERGGVSVSTVTNFVSHMISKSGLTEHYPDYHTRTTLILIHQRMEREELDVQPQT